MKQIIQVHTTKSVVDAYRRISKESGVPQQGLFRKALEAFLDKQNNEAARLLAEWE